MKQRILPEDINLTTPSPSRRELLKAGACGVTAAIVTGLPVTGEATGSSRAQPSALKGPILNHDSTAFFVAYNADQMSGALVDDWVDSLAAAGAGVMMSNINAMRANYASKVWEPDWHGYDPGGPDDQPVLKHLPRDVVALTRRRLESAKKLADLDINFHQRAIAGCRKHGIGAWISVRMNDLHDCDLPDSPLLSTFFKEHRDWARVPYRSGWTDRALDWAHAEVREHYLNLIREALEMFDLDGIELDWMRFGYFFGTGRELEGGKILNQFIAQVRRETGKAAERLRHPVALGVRVPSTPETARNLGLDGAAWARAGLIDLLVVTPFWATCEFNMPMATWRALLDGTGVVLAGGLEVLYRSMPGGPAIEMTPEQAAGAAMAVLAGGANQVYLFNYFPESKPWPTDRFNATVRAMASREALDPLARRHAVTYRDVHAPGEAADHPLPTSGGQCAFRVQTGPKPVARKVEVLLELERPREGELEPPTVRVNGTPCPAPAKQGAAVFVYPVPDAALADEAHVIETTAAAGKASTIVRVEFAIGAQGTSADPRSRDPPR